VTVPTLDQKLAILSDAAKYDASCASSGGEKRINVELPTAEGLTRLAPEKSATGIHKTMAGVRQRREVSREATHTGKRKALFAPAGQSTQMIVVADTASDGTILTQAAQLYAGYGLSRVYCSAFSPIPDSSALLPLKSPPLLRAPRSGRA
jgi:predicted DNA-binding helix-hairpin-helix protein